MLTMNSSEYYRLIFFTDRVFLITGGDFYKTRDDSYMLRPAISSEGFIFSKLLLFFPIFLDNFRGQLCACPLRRFTYATNTSIYRVIEILHYGRVDVVKLDLSNESRRQFWIFLVLNCWYEYNLSTVVIVDTLSRSFWLLRLSTIGF